MLCGLAVATGRLPSEWIEEADRDLRAVLTVLDIIEESQQQQQRKKG